MKQPSYLLIPVIVLIFAGSAGAQEYPIMNMIADKVIQKYQQSTCEQLWIKKEKQSSQPKPQMEQDLMRMLQSDPQMRQAFIDRVAGPIVNRMFECGLIP